MINWHHNGWSPKIPKHPKIPIFDTQTVPPNVPPNEKFGGTCKIWGRGQGTPVHPIFIQNLLPIYMLTN